MNLPWTSPEHTDDDCTGEFCDCVPEGSPRLTGTPCCDLDNSAVECAGMVFAGLQSVLRNDEAKRGQFCDAGVGAPAAAVRKLKPAAPNRPDTLDPGRSVLLRSEDARQLKTYPRKPLIEAST